MIEQWLRDHVPGKWLTRGGKVEHVYASVWSDGGFSADPMKGFTWYENGRCFADHREWKRDLIAPVGVWLTHDGGRKPEWLPPNTVVELKLRDGHVTPSHYASGLVWEDEGDPHVVSAFLIVQSVERPELETWAEGIKTSSPEIPDNSAAFQYVSDAAWEAYDNQWAFANRATLTATVEDAGTVLRTRQEWEALERLAAYRLDICMKLTSEATKPHHGTWIAMGEHQAILAAKDAIIQDLHKQLSGHTTCAHCHLAEGHMTWCLVAQEQRRDDDGFRKHSGVAGSEVHGEDSRGVLPVRSGGRNVRNVAPASLTAAYWQDARLGTQLPPGEPVEPMSARSWKRRMLP